MNAEHLRLCASAEWAETVERVLEVGAGPGLVTEVLARRAGWLHVGDVFLPADPAALPGRLRAAGFADPEVEVDPGADRFRFAAVAT